ncbi:MULTISPECIES: hypothetical protein [unclassified Guyparkeria]|uniref:hypothetical protein n=1 Tax=unclassified Guyparkeria TaxID=2626246 RepID=UPI0007337B21|nr:MULTISPECIES: hypothetical protein [unclassified Guyparkeria]KTG16636.1 hypothetical protein AUR63_00810 [Guyparkeria sp. XI15]OAE85670.1 hypothetical protein AWR35_00810 [Guyparkeria sp. WRN-7]
MSEYRDWQHPEGGPPETAPERLVDVFTAPWLDPAAVPPTTGVDAAAADGRWLAVVAILAVLAVAMVAWRRRRDLRLALTLLRLERLARRTDAGASLRSLQDRTAMAIARWQHGGQAPRRETLPPPWSDWMHRLDHARFATGRTAEPREFAEQLRRMRRALWRRGARA